jgi:membrane associated rhomboid family serine protease
MGKFTGPDSLLRRVPPITLALIVINVAIFLYEVRLGAQSLGKQRAFVVKYALSLDGLQHGYYWKLITFQFLHSGWLHLLLNCWSIFIFGPPLEQILGRTRFSSLYLLGGVAGGALQVFASLLSFERFGGSVVGASAGVFALISAFTYIFPNARMTLLLFFVIPLRMTANRMLTIASVITVVGIIQPNWLLGSHVAHAAHMGGLIAGLIVVRIFMRRFRQESMSQPPIIG